jgi:hypothetical protein
LYEIEMYLPTLYYIKIFRSVWEYRKFPRSQKLIQLTWIETNFILAPFCCEIKFGENIGHIKNNTHQESRKKSKLFIELDKLGLKKMVERQLFGIPGKFFAKISFGNVIENRDS